MSDNLFEQFTASMAADASSSLLSNGSHDNNDSDPYLTQQQLEGFLPSGADSMAGDNPLFHTDLLPEEFPDHVKSLFTVLYVTIMLLGLGGNLTTAIVVAVNREMQTVTNVFLVSLAASDALIAGVNMPAQLRFYLSNEWTLGEQACKLTAYIQGVVIVASILTLTALAIDRYYAICHPLRARNVHTTTRALILVAVIWGTSLLLVSPQLFIQRLEPLLAVQLDKEPMFRIAQVCVEYFYSDPRLGIAYTAFFYIVLYAFPVVTMFATYGKIASKLWRRRPIGETTDAQRDSDRRLKEKKRIVCMLVLIVALFTLCWFPFFTAQLYLLVDGDGHRDHNVRMTIAILQLIGYSNCCVNPIVYCFLNESFQKHLLRTLRCRCTAAAYFGVAKARRPPNMTVTPGGSAGRGGAGGSGSALGGPAANRRRRSSTETDMRANGTLLTTTAVRSVQEHNNCSTPV